MATTLSDNITPSIKLNLGEAVASRITAFNKARSQAQMVDETAFYKAVAQGMSFKDQVAYRESQLEREKGRTVPDVDYINSVEKEVANLKQQARFEAIRTEYKQALDQVVSGKKSWEDYSTTIKGLLGSNADPEIVTELRSQLQTADQQVFQHTQDLINNEVELAKSDKSITLIDKAMADVSNEKAKALGAGDQTRASLLDLKLSTLQQSRTDIEITAKTNAMLANRSRKASAVGYLQDLNDQLAQSDTSTPIIYNGVHYDSEKQFWQLQLNKYIETNFFNDLSTEYQKFNQSVSDVNGYVPEDVLKNVQSDFQQLSSRPELQPYLNRLSQVQSSTLSNAVSLSAKAIVAKFNNDLNYSDALTQLQSLKDKFGIDVSTYANQVVQKAAQDRGQLVQDVLDTASTFVASGMSYEAAVNKAIGAVKSKTGQIVSPTVSNEELINKTPEQIAKEAPAKTAESASAAPPTAEPTKPTTTQPNDQQKQNIGSQTPGQAAGLTTPPPATAPDPATPTAVDLSHKYGVSLVGKNRTVFDKNSQKALSAADFQTQTGYDINDKTKNFKFDETYRPPTNVK